MQHFLGWCLEWAVQNCLLCQVLLSSTNAFPFDFWGIVVLKLSWKFVLLSSNQFKAFNFYQIVQFLSFSGARWECTFSVYMCQSYIKLYISLCAFSCWLTCSNCKIYFSLPLQFGLCENSLILMAWEPKARRLFKSFIGEIFFLKSLRKDISSYIQDMS